MDDCGSRLSHTQGTFLPCSAKPQRGSRVSVSRGDERAGAVGGKPSNRSGSHQHCQALNEAEPVWRGVFRLPRVSHTLARPSVLVERKTRVARTGIGSRNIRAQLLAVAIATFINVWKQKHTPCETFLLITRATPAPWKPMSSGDRSRREAKGNWREDSTTKCQRG